MSDLQTQNIQNPRQGSAMDWGFPKQQNTASHAEERVIRVGARQERNSQGSILGPLLYVNDMPTLSHNTAKMFADDTKLYAKIYSTDDCSRLQ